MKRIINFISRDKKRIIIISVSLVVIVGVLLTLFIINSNRTIQTNNAAYENTSNDKEQLSVNDNEQSNRQNINIDVSEQDWLVALNTNSYGISTTSKFKLTTKEPTTEDHIKGAISVIPKKTFSVEKLSAKEYIIKFDSAFEQDSLVKMQYSSEEETSGWAFQTQKIFGVSGTSPGDGVLNAPVNAGIEIYFTKEAPKNIDKYFSISPEVSGSFRYENNKIIFIPDKDLMSGTQYMVTISKGYGDKDDNLKEDYKFSFKTERKFGIKDFDFYNMDSVLNTKNRMIEFYVKTYTEDDLSVKLNMYTINDSKEYINGLDYIYSREDSSQPFYNILNNIEYSDITTINTKIQTIDDMNGKKYYLELPNTLSTGYYLLEVIKNDIKAYQFIQVSNYEAYVAVGEKEVLLWIVDSEQGKTAQGFNLELDGKSLGKTNSDGILYASLDNELDSDKNWYPVITDLQGNTFVVNLKANYYYYYYHGYSKKQYWSFLYTDRIAYLPTDTINVFGFVQKIEGQDTSQVEVRLVSNQRVIDSKKVNLTDIGSFDCNFDIENYLYPYANIEVYDGETLIESENIQVCYFEKPTYKIETDISKEFVLSGDTVDVTAKEMFYEGTPVINGSIEITTNQRFNNVNSATLYCDENGESIMTIKPESTNENNWYPYFYSLYFTSKELQKDYNSARDGFIFFPRDCMLELSEESEESGVSRISADFHSISLSQFRGNMNDYSSFRGEPIANHDMTITITEKYYEKIYKGQTYDYINKVTHDLYDYKRVENIISTEAVITDENGYFSFEFKKPVEDRYYIIEVSAKDKQGNLITESISCGNYQYNNFSEPNIYLEKTDYKKNETVTARIFSGNEEMINTDKNLALFMMCKEGIISYDVSDDLETSFVFDDKYISDTYIMGIYFDGNELYQLWRKTIYYDYDTTEALNIELTPNEVNYRPGDSVSLNIMVTDADGNPVKGDVNISVVDEAFLSLFEDNSNPLRELYEYSFGPGILRDTIFKDGYNPLCDAAEMGGYGDIQIRDDFDNTAYFNTVTTNEDGIGTLIFNMPDSLTSWRITASAFTKDLKAGRGTIDINCKLPFFITDVLFDTYLSQDEINATLITSGTKVDKNMVIKYTASVEDEKGNVTEYTAKSNGLSYTNLPIGKLDAGTYKVTLTAESGNYSDGIRKTIKVVDTMQYFELTKKENLTNDIKFATNENMINLTLLNEDAAENYKRILDIYNQKSSNRIDFKAIAYTAGNYLNKTYNSELSLNFISEFRTSMKGDLFSNEDMYSLGNASSIDHQVIPFVLMSDLYKNWFTQDELSVLTDDLEEQMYSQDATSENNFASMWSLAIMNKPVLLDVYKVQESNAYFAEDLNFEKLYTLLSLIELGDLENAKLIYIDFISRYGNSENDFLYFKGDDTRKFTALMMLAGVMLGDMSNADLMYNYIKNGSDYKYPTNMEKLEYLIAKKPEYTTCEFSYTLNGKENTVNLNYNDVIHLNLLPEEAENINFKVIKGNVSVISDFIGTVKQIEPAKDLSIKRTYTTIDDEEVNNSNLKQGDIIYVSINVTIPSNLWFFEVNDILPAGFAYYDFVDNGNARVECQGRHVNIYGYKNKSNNLTITYKAIAIAKGSYTADAVVVKNFYSNEANYDEQKTITIH